MGGHDVSNRHSEFTSDTDAECRLGELPYQTQNVAPAAIPEFLKKGSRLEAPKVFLMFKGFFIFRNTYSSMLWMTSQRMEKRPGMHGSHW